MSQERVYGGLKQGYGNRDGEQWKDSRDIQGKELMGYDDGLDGGWKGEGDVKVFVQFLI